MKIENYKQLLTSEFLNPEMTKEDFINTLEHFAELHHKEKELKESIFTDKILKMQKENYGFATSTHIKLSSICEGFKNN